MAAPHQVTEEGEESCGGASGGYSEKKMVAENVSIFWRAWHQRLMEQGRIAGEGKWQAGGIGRISTTPHAYLHTPPRCRATAHTCPPHHRLHHDAYGRGGASAYFSRKMAS